MIVEDGKKALARMIAIIFDEIQLGNGSDDTSARQKKLDNAITGKKTASSVTVLNNQVIYEVTFSGSDINGTNVSELGLFSNLNAVPSTGDILSNYREQMNDKLLSRVNFNSVGPIASNDSVTFTFVMEVE